MFGLFTTFVIVFNITFLTIRYNWKRGKFEFNLMTWEPSTRTTFNSVELNGKYGKMVNPTRMFAHAPLCNGNRHQNASNVLWECFQRSPHTSIPMSLVTCKRFVFWRNEMTDANQFYETFMTVSIRSSQVL